MNTIVRDVVIIAFFIVVTIAALAVAAVFVIRATKEPSIVSLTQPYTRIESPQEPAPAVATNIIALYYFDAARDVLVPDSRSITAFENDPVGALSRLIIELLEGPEAKGLTKVIPKGTDLLASFYDASTKTVVLDFSKEIRLNHPRSPSAEWATIYSIVSTVCGLDPVRFEKVKFLCEGEEVSTLAGNYDLSKPFAPDTTYLKE